MKLHHPSMPGYRQRGMSLVVVLILTLIMTIVGLTVVRSTILRERMSANMYDRSLAFQASESVLREAEDLVRQAVVAGSSIGVDCTAPGASCPVPPANTFTGGGNGWVSGTDSQQLSIGPPQYFIQYLGQRDSIDTLSLGSSANEAQYGGSGGVAIESLYRIVARSHDPALNADDADRAVVVLQSNIAVK